MKPAVPTSPTDPNLPPFPIEKLVDIPEGVAITPEFLEIANLSTIPRDVTLVTRVGFTKVLIRQDAGTLRIKAVRKIRPGDALAQKYSARQVALTMSDAAGYVPKDAEEASRLPNITASGWTVPDEANWVFYLPLDSSGLQLLAAVKSSDEFVMKVTETLLAQQAAS